MSRHALLAAGLAAAGAQVQPGPQAPRVRVFELGRVFLRDASVQDHRLAAWPALHQPMRVAGLAWGDVDSLQWGGKERAWTSLT
jgi:phenylalanyl-tRNA synthetase beta subunit